MLAGGVARLDVVPVLPDGAGRELGTAAHLVPADHGLAGRGADRGGVSHEGEEVLVGGRVRLVPADVQVGAGRHCRDLAEHVGDEAGGVGLPDAEVLKPTSMPVYGCGSTPSHASSG